MTDVGVGLGEIGAGGAYAPGSRRLPVSVVLAFVFMLAVAVCAIFGTWVAPHDPDAQDLLLGTTGPSGGHWFGTDDLGRDVFSRVVAGTSSSVVGPIVFAIGVVVLGGTLGVIAGYTGGWLGAVIARWVDLMWALPAFLVTIMLLGVIGGGYWGAVAVLIVLNCAWDCRLLRGAAIEQRGLPYIEAARTLGLGRSRIIVRHIAPNVLPIAVTSFCLDFASGLTVMAGLAFLGFGLAPGTANWGTMINENREILFENPAASLAPAGMVIITAIAMELIGNWTYSRLSERGKSR